MRPQCESKRLAINASATSAGECSRSNAAQGKLMAQLMSVLAEFERDLLRERVRSGMAAAKARGVTFGRQAGFAPTQRRKGALILSKRNEGKSIREIASDLEISKATVQRVLKCGKALFV